MTTKAAPAKAPQIAIGAHVTVPPLPGMPGLPGVWNVEGEMWCGARFLLLPRRGQPGWHVIAETRCVLAAERERKASV